MKIPRSWVRQCTELVKDPAEVSVAELETREGREGRDETAMSRLAHTEGYPMFLVPDGEKPERLYLTYWPNAFAKKTTII